MGIVINLFLLVPASIVFLRQVFFSVVFFLNGLAQQRFLKQKSVQCR